MVFIEGREEYSGRISEEEEHREDISFSSAGKKTQEKDRFSFVFNQFLTDSHHCFHQLLTSYTRMQCDFQESVQLFREQDTVEVAGELFGAFAVFLQHFKDSKERISPKSVTLLKGNNNSSHFSSSRSNNARSSRNNTDHSLNKHSDRGTANADGDDVSTTTRREIDIQGGRGKAINTVTFIGGKDNNKIAAAEPDSSSRIKSFKSFSSSTTPKKTEDRMSAMEMKKGEEITHGKGRKANNVESSTGPTKEPRKQVRHRSDVSDDEDNARETVLKCSKSPVMVSRRLDKVKSQLDQEKVKSEKMIRRKITEHQEPLYFRVMRETIREYESHLDSQQGANIADANTGTTRREAEQQKAEFLEILQQKLKENIPITSPTSKVEEEAHEQEGPSSAVATTFDNMKLSREKKVSITEPVYGEVLTKTLQQYGQRKMRRRQSLAKGEDPAICPSPNLFVMFEENLVENQMMEKEEEVEDEPKDRSNEDYSEDSDSEQEIEAYVGSKPSYTTTGFVGDALSSEITKSNNYHDRDDNSLLMSEDPVYMVVLKHALKQRRQSLHKKKTRQSLKRSAMREKELVVEEEMETITAITSQAESNNNSDDSNKKNNGKDDLFIKDSRDARTKTTKIKKPSSTQQQDESPRTTNTSHQNRNKTNHSRSSSDISIASEEVQEINRKTFISACQQRQHHQGGQGGGGAATKPAIPVIPSPDYTVPDEGAKHPHHVYRPFWSDNEEGTSGSSRITSIVAVDKAASASAFTPTNEKLLDGESPLLEQHKQQQQQQKRQHESHQKQMQQQQHSQQQKPHSNSYPTKRKVSSSSLKGVTIKEEETLPLSSSFEFVDPSQLVIYQGDESDGGGNDSSGHAKRCSKEQTIEHSYKDHKGVKYSPNQQKQRQQHQQMPLSFNLVTTTLINEDGTIDRTIRADSDASPIQTSPSAPPPPAVDRSRKPTKSKSTTPIKHQENTKTNASSSPMQHQQHQQQQLNKRHHHQHYMESASKGNLSSPRLLHQHHLQQNESTSPPRIIVSRSPSPSSSHGASSMSPVSFCSDISIQSSPAQQHRNSDISPSPPFVQQRQQTTPDVVQMVPPPDYSPPASPDLMNKNQRKQHQREDKRRFMTPSPQQPVLKNLIQVLTDNEKEDDDDKSNDKNVIH